ncbi:uncharacterized protein LTR77_008865 [Saxophila tyrrhenica]|uniref:Carbonic anhydrase n=1 Tax=Saxophila tyrrhenica TaxID=1690608 RepID=A0AAV9P459_9PEZI|nr:hypothetical protein LTR77_008865 [Saxophila tyrrhenica]
MPFSAFPNVKATMVISCMDPRANPNEFWAFSETSPVQPAVLRNAGGRVTEDTLRSIRVLSGIMGNGKNTVGAVAVVHHADCGLRNFSDERVGELLGERAGLDEGKKGEVGGMWFGSFSGDATLEKSVREDMEKIKADPYLPRDLEVIGYTYDGTTGKTTEVGVL